MGEIERKELNIEDCFCILKNNLTEFIDYIEYLERFYHNVSLPADDCPMVVSVPDAVVSYIDTVFDIFERALVSKRRKVFSEIKSIIDNFDFENPNMGDLEKFYKLKEEREQILHEREALISLREHNKIRGYTFTDLDFKNTDTPDETIAPISRHNRFGRR